MFYDDDVDCSDYNLVFISIHSFWYHGRSVYLTQTSHIYGLASVSFICLRNTELLVLMFLFFQVVLNCVF